MRSVTPEIPLNLKAKGDLAELTVAVDLLRRGHKVAIPYGEDCDFDLVLIRDNRLERVQVKHARSDGAVNQRSLPLPFPDQRQDQTDEALHSGNHRPACGL
jgi:hypothetical protein